jgi:soluble lytic murein transglycosylase
MLRYFLYASPVILSAAALAATLSPSITGSEAVTGGSPAPAPSISVTSIDAALMSWDRLRQTDSLSFSDYASFLLAHPGWPGEARMRRIAENKADVTIENPTLIVSFFTRYPPSSAAGKARYADALSATGRPAEAMQAARSAWAAGNMAPDIEARLIARFGPNFTATDNDQRMERLLMERSTGAASRQLALVSPARKPLYAARLAMQMKSPSARDGQVGGTSDPGFLIDRARWLSDTGRWSEARSSLSTPMQLSAPPLDARRWLAVLLDYAQAASKDNQASIALGIALNADRAFPSGANVRETDLGTRDVYTSLVWLGGQMALRQLNRPADAMTLFDRYSRAAKTPQTQTKGLYWAGRAALVAGDNARATAYFQSAAQHGDQFYGQLAAERVGVPSGIIPQPQPIEVTGAVRASFGASELVQAARRLGQRAQWRDQTLFLRTIAENVETDADHVLAADLARTIARPDLGVMVSRNWRNNGRGDPIRVGFPELSVPPTQQRQWTMIHAITRQESQFDRQIVSSAGARGLMQLMPGTARETAGKIGLTYDFDRLTSDPAYNIMLGSSFFANMLDSFGGNYVLAVAAYNAGPGNVRKWLAANGDPRMSGVDVIDWIEAIPFTETRGYVQRVLENAVVYDTLNPATAMIPKQNRLSSYLGKNKPG